MFEAIFDSEQRHPQLPLSQLPGPQAFGMPAVSLDGSSPVRMSWPASPGGTTFSGHLPVPADPKGRAAVCSTMKDVRGRIDSWVRWHLWLGFSRLYIFFDDSTETTSIEAAKAAAEPWGERAVVALLRGSEALRAAWARQPSWASMGMNADRDVQVRQLLNAQLAMELARADGRRADPGRDAGIAAGRAGEPLPGDQARRVAVKRVTKLSHGKPAQFVLHRTQKMSPVGR